jgi:hypothetical protein
MDKKERTGPGWDKVFGSVVAGKPPERPPSIQFSIGPWEEMGRNGARYIKEESSSTGTDQETPAGDIKE